MTPYAYLGISVLVTSCCWIGWRYCAPAYHTAWASRTSSQSGTSVIQMEWYKTHIMNPSPCTPYLMRGITTTTGGNTEGTRMLWRPTYLSMTAWKRSHSDTSLYVRSPAGLKNSVSSPALTNTGGAFKSYAPSSAGHLSWSSHPNMPRLFTSPPSDDHTDAWLSDEASEDVWGD